MHLQLNDSLNGIWRLQLLMFFVCNKTDNRWFLSYLHR